MSGYLNTLLFKKLVIKGELKLYIKKPPENYMDLIKPVAENVLIVKRLSAELDMIHFLPGRNKS